MGIAAIVGVMVMAAGVASYLSVPEPVAVTSASVLVLAKAGRQGVVSKSLQADGYLVGRIGTYAPYVEVMVQPDTPAADLIRALFKAHPDIDTVSEGVHGQPAWLPPDALYPQQWALNNTGTNPLECPDEATCELDRTDPFGQTGGCCVPDACPSPDPAPHVSQAGIDINVEGAWDHTRGQGALVAVIDSEFQRDHPDLRPNLWLPPHLTPDDCTGDYQDSECFGMNFAWANTLVGPYGNESTFAHGGFVTAQIVGAHSNGTTGSVGTVGVAPEATAMMLQIDELATAADALGFAVAHGVDVVNISYAWFTCVEGFEGESALFEAALTAANDAGVAVVIAAGNYGTAMTACEKKPPGSGRRICNFDFNSAAALPYPASLGSSFDNVVVVSSVQRDGSRPGSANFGSNIVDVFAPGDYVLGIDFDWADREAEIWQSTSGTSHAAPYVAGAIALIVAHHGVTGVEAINILQQTVNPDPVLLPFRADVAWGGMIDIDAAMDWEP